jgi:hypothetical protein
MTLRFYRTICIFILIGLLASSCSLAYSGKRGSRSTNYGSLSDPNMRNSSRMYGSHEPGGIVVHNNSQLRYSRDLSMKVGHVPGVAAAIVMLTERNAYAAVLIKNNAHSTWGVNTKRETNNTGTDIGIYDPINFNEAVENWRLATGVNNYQTVQKHENINSAFKQNIAQTIRAANSTIHDVFISANRDFINQLNAYAIESDWGNASLNIRLNEFNGTANRLFGVSDGAARK